MKINYQRQSFYRIRRNSLSNTDPLYLQPDTAAADQFRKTMNILNMNILVENDTSAVNLKSRGAGQSLKTSAISRTLRKTGANLTSTGQLKLSTSGSPQSKQKNTTITRNNNSTIDTLLEAASTKSYKFLKDRKIAQDLMTQYQ